ncbi:coth-domain-containing protein [Basidiobolus meristosporus CBS 931.73]|uniref:Coth-domain-containing protein n=1 Tax=Basidiobolus meristosporus CBS 931.73 TaxID=1314790 RepID=A0A1Y1Y095_9FUNG|nr:coth-domain-containing protein [Basidiobolus meristosporus CBS 931.73]|eukprot:ORX91136.1 coth-domain-containing protein [Basidiobolus meristosporus CBS 931.73]
MSSALSKLLLLGLAVTSTLADVTFNVVGFPEGDGTSLAVSVNNQLTKLSTTPETYPLWSGTVAGAKAPLKYHYAIVDGSSAVVDAEKFERDHAEGDKSKNDFFSRPLTVTKLPEVPPSYDPWPFTRPAMFDEGKIGTFHLTADPEQVKGIHGGGIDNDAPDIKVDMTYVHPDFSIALKNVSWGISGQSTRAFAKQSYKLKFKDSGKFLTTGSIKLRAEESDPTMMREKVYLDLLNSLGVPAIQANWARLFVNKQPVGLFLMTDDIKTPYIKRAYHAGNDKAKTGPEFKCNALEVTNEASLAYKGEDIASYDFKGIYEIEEAPDGEDVNKKDLIAFTKAINDFNPEKADSAALTKFAEVWDHQTFLRAMALEFLAGSWDTFWVAASNYYLYKPPGKPWNYIPTDFDYTFGNDYPTSQLGTYQEFSGGKSRPPLDKLLAVPSVRKDFEEMLKTITNRVFNSEILDARIDAYLAMIKDELSWDRQLTRLAPGKSRNWTVDSAVQNVAGAVPTMPFGLKPWIAERVKLLQTQLNYQQKLEKYTSKVNGNSTTVGAEGSDNNKKPDASSSAAKVASSVLLLALSLAAASL